MIRKPLNGCRVCGRFPGGAGANDFHWVECVCGNATCRIHGNEGGEQLVREVWDKCNPIKDPEPGGLPSAEPAVFSKRPLYIEQKRLECDLLRVQIDIAKEELRQLEQKEPYSVTIPKPGE